MPSHPAEAFPKIHPALHPVMQRKAFLTLGAALFLGCLFAQSARAEEPAPATFALIVRGGNPPLNATYNDAHELVITFQKSEKAAGDRGHYQHLPHGSAAWLDRPLADDEPTELRQKMSREKAGEIITHLGSKERFWKFMCFNTGNGFFQAVSSEGVREHE